MESLAIRLSYILSYLAFEALVPQIQMIIFGKSESKI